MAFYHPGRLHKFRREMGHLSHFVTVTVYQIRLYGAVYWVTVYRTRVEASNRNLKANCPDPNRLIIEQNFDKLACYGASMLVIAIPDERSSYRTAARPCAKSGVIPGRGRRPRARNP